MRVPRQYLNSSMNNNTTADRTEVAQVRAGDAEAASASAILAWVLVHSTFRAPTWAGALAATVAYGVLFRQRLTLVRASDDRGQTLNLPLRAYLFGLVMVRFAEIAWDGLSPRQWAVLAASAVWMGCCFSWIFAAIWQRIRIQFALKITNLLRVVLVLVGGLLLSRGLTVLPLAAAVSVAWGDNDFADAQRTENHAQKPQTWLRAAIVCGVGATVVLAIARWGGSAQGVHFGTTVFLH